MLTAESIALNVLGAVNLPLMDIVCAMPAMLFELLAQDDAVAPEMTTFQKFLSNPLILPVGLFALFYITFIAPERRRKAEEAKLISSLKKNDRVVTVGGIHGTVVATSPETGVVTLRIDENSNTRIRVNRTAIANILGDGKDNKDTPSKDKEPASETKDK